MDISVPQDELALVMSACFVMIASDGITNTYVLVCFLNLRRVLGGDVLSDVDITRIKGY